MKTSKEILLAKHQATMPRLDEIRKAVVADLIPKPAREEDPFFVKIWQELIWPCRRIWVGLAAVWLGVLAFNASQADAPRSVMAKAPTTPSELRMAFREQRRVIDEIITENQPTEPAEPTRKSNNKPRTENRATAMA
jgi:hypothetical protein